MSEQHQRVSDPQHIESQKEADEVFQDFNPFFKTWVVQPRREESMEWELKIVTAAGEEFLFTWIQSRQPTKSQRQTQLRMFLFDIRLGNLAPGEYSGLNYLALQQRKKSTSL